MNWKDRLGPKKKTWKLSDPLQARDWLKHLRIKGAKIDFVELANGTQLTIDECSDAQIVNFCEEFSLAMAGKKNQA